MVNLPAALLVTGDTVLLKPGQRVLADCVPLVSCVLITTSAAPRKGTYIVE